MNTEKKRLLYLLSKIKIEAEDLGVYLVYDRVDLINERPALEKTNFLARCVSDKQLSDMILSLRKIGCYVELFEGEKDLVSALVNDHITNLRKKTNLIYNGIEGGIGYESFKPGRKSLLPALADSYGLLCSNSNACACAIGRHKFYYFCILQALNIRTPKVWHYDYMSGWLGDSMPAEGMKVIVKSTYESWSVGVTDKSIFEYSSESIKTIHTISDKIGQSVCVQEFIEGVEVCVPVISAPEPIATTPVKIVLSKAPDKPESVITIDDNIQDRGVMHEVFCYSDAVITQLKTTSLAVFKILEMSGFSRIDYRVDKEGTIWVIDVGISPGLSRKSSSFVSFKTYGFNYDEFIQIVMSASI